MRRFLFVGCILIAVQSQAENHLLLMGGSGEPAGVKTIFDSTAKTLSQFAKEKSYETTVSFNGGHRETEKMLAESFQGASAFSPTAYQRILQEYDRKVKSGDKVILFVNSHGLANEGAQKSHSVHCGTGACNLDEMNSLIAKLESKGAQVAVIDASCYSGGSVKLGSEKTCVLSASREDSVGYSATNVLLAQGLREKRNLEEVFLQAQSGFYGQGNIKTPAGQKTRELLNQFFMDFKNPAPAGGSVRLRDCQFNIDQSLKKLQNLKDHFRQINVVAEPELKSLEKALNEYQRRQRRAEELIGKLQTSGMNEASFPQGSLTWNALVQLTPQQIQNQISQMAEELKNTTNELGRKELSDRISLLNSLEDLKKSLRVRDGRFAQYESESLELKTLLSANPNDIPEGSLIMAQFKILEPERSLYKKIYNSMKGPNSCASFSL